MFTLYYQCKIYIIDNYTIHNCQQKKIQYYTHLFRNNVNIILIEYNVNNEFSISLFQICEELNEFFF